MKEYGYAIEQLNDEIGDLGTLVGFCFEDYEAMGTLKRLHKEDPDHVYVAHRVLVTNEDKIGNYVYVISAGHSLLTPYVATYDDYKHARKEASRIEQVEGEATKVDFVHVLR